MKTILGVTLILALSFAISGCVEVNTVPTQIEAGDNVEEVEINSEDNTKGETI